MDHFGLLAPFYERFIPPPDPKRWQTLLNLPEDGRSTALNLLDAGGGTGRVSGQLRPFVRQLVISDESAKMLAQAQAKLRCCTVVSAVEKMPFADASFDRIMVVDALHHFAHQETAVAELVRLLKPGGRLVIEEPNLHQLVVKWVALAEKAALMRSKFYYPEAIQEMVTRLGVPARVETDGRFTAWVIADKRADKSANKPAVP